MISGRIPQQIIDDILGRVDIVEVISSYIPLKRAGRNFKAVCPFHHEKTASFMVSPERQIYHCFGCGKGGNMINFLMQYERLEFPEAVEVLAKKAGVIIPEREKRDYQAQGLVTRLYKINELATLFYEQNLNSAAGTQVKNYLLKRGLSADSIKAFRLGFATPSWDALINYLRTKNISFSLLEKARLITPKKGGGYVDLFRNRIIFPIFDIKSRTLGFGARIIPFGESENKTAPKYINSAETAVYIKRRNLYGLNFAKEAIRKADSVAIVEGYLDFIIPFQAGLQNIIASLGTALTYEQIRLIKRYTHNAVMVYDADSAGETATLRSLDMFVEEGVNLKVASLPSGFDPDSFVRKFGINAFKEKINQALTLFDYKLKVLKSRFNIKTTEGKVMSATEMLPTISRFKNDILKAEYVKKLALELDAQEDSLWRELKKVKQERLYLDPAAFESRKPLNVNPTEKLLIKIMLEEAEFVEQVKKSLEPEDFQDQNLAKVASIMFDLLEQKKNISAGTIINYFNDEAITQIISESALMPELPEADKERIIVDCIQRLKKERLRIRKERLHEEIKLAQDSKDEEKLEKLMWEFHLLVKDRRDNGCFSQVESQTN
ncbi:MAG: DNA primase [Candidatus Omnitrophota bacterium]|nr:MAG: DNA primase [Candidatus Omnitrophota bacterium]